MCDTSNLAPHVIVLFTMLLRMLSNLHRIASPFDVKDFYLCIGLEGSLQSVSALFNVESRHNLSAGSTRKEILVLPGGQQGWLDGMESVRHQHERERDTERVSLVHLASIVSSGRILVCVILTA